MTEINHFQEAKTRQRARYFLDEAQRVGGVVHEALEGGEPGLLFLGGALLVLVLRLRLARAAQVLQLAVRLQHLVGHEARLLEVLPVELHLWLGM